MNASPACGTRSGACSLSLTHAVRVALGVTLTAGTTYLCTAVRRNEVHPRNGAARAFSHTFCTASHRPSRKKTTTIPESIPCSIGLHPRTPVVLVAALAMVVEAKPRRVAARTLASVAVAVAVAAAAVACVLRGQVVPSSRAVPTATPWSSSLCHRSPWAWNWRRPWATTIRRGDFLSSTAGSMFTPRRRALGAWCAGVSCT